MNAYLLIVEDEESLARPVVRGLEEEGYRVDWVDNGNKGLTKVRSEQYDACIIDWRLPDLDGRTLIRRVRQDGFQTPIILLTALRDVDHRVAGLDAGADDYLTKPFAFEELLARLRALLRRAALPVMSADQLKVPLDVGNLRVETSRRTATCNGTPLDLRTKEFLLLELLAQHAGEIVTRTTIAERVWGAAYETTDNAIDVTISGIRQRLAETGVMQGLSPSNVVIDTIRGVGYRLSVRSQV